MSRRTIAELEAELADLKAQLKLRDEVIKRLLVAPPTPVYVPMPYPVPSIPAPQHVIPYYPVYPSWIWSTLGTQPNLVGMYDTTGCVPTLPYGQSFTMTTGHLGGIGSS